MIKTRQAPLSKRCNIIASDTFSGKAQTVFGKRNNSKIFMFFYLKIISGHNFYKP
jgi:hypothetical protein